MFNDKRFGRRESAMIYLAGFMVANTDFNSKEVAGRAEHIVDLLGISEDVTSISTEKDTASTSNGNGYESSTETKLRMYVHVLPIYATASSPLAAGCVHKALMRSNCKIVAQVVMMDEDSLRCREGTGLTSVNMLRGALNHVGLGLEYSPAYVESVLGCSVRELVDASVFEDWLLFAPNRVKQYYQYKEV